MLITKNGIVKRMVMLLVTVMIIGTGCANRSNNQMRQQGVQPQQVPSQPPSNTDNRIQIAKQAADNLVKLKGVKQANVLVMQRNAYVAVVLDTNQGHLTRELEDQMAQQVRASDPNIQNVFVSTNPEFVDRVNRYVTDVRQGRPVSGFFEEFSEIVRRIFPKAR